MKIHIFTALILTSCVSSAAIAQTKETWIYSMNPDGGIAWNQTDLVWNKDDNSVRGTFIAYIKPPAAVGDKEVSYVLDEFLIKCSGPEYFVEKNLFLGMDGEVIMSTIATKKEPLKLGSPWQILSEALCKGTKFPNQQTQQNVDDRAEVLALLAAG